MVRRLVGQLIPCKGLPLWNTIEDFSERSLAGVFRPIGDIVFRRQCGDLLRHGRGDE